MTESCIHKSLADCRPRYYNESQLLTFSDDIVYDSFKELEPNKAPDVVLEFTKGPH